PRHLISPEVIRSVEQEEKEEALGHQPFSAYSSFLSMKHSTDQVDTFITPYEKRSIPKKKRSNSTTTTNIPIVRERLKRPPNAYLLFNRDMRRKLLALDPKMTVSEISKEIGDRWKYLSPNERQHYMEAAQLLKQDHLKNHPDFIYTRRSKAELAEAKRLRGRQRSESGQRDPRGRKKKRHKHPTAPKHPMSGFLFFLGAVRPEVAQQFPGSTVGPISKEISSRWKRMSTKDREPWLLKAEKDKARYAEEMQIYMK
ncbi:high mobility group box domain-containing protein, partial [Halteromyces radiatus]|uniref:high mobility group box domain-containing protein n=1 Tax=Halteromyces radiatus TaxID=101107 RepID=UPI00222027FE